MKVKIRNLSNSNEEIQIRISKTSNIARLKKKIKKKFAIKPILQKLYYGGKHLELENTLYDYKINKNDVIQLLVNDQCVLKNLISPISDLTKKKTEQAKDEKEKYENLENADSDYYNIEDPIDCLDSEYGAWFEATIKRICKKDNKLIYVIKWDLVENAQLFYASEESIRPRAYQVIATENLRMGEKVMINHNLDHPKDIGFWYDFGIEKILFSTNNRCTLTGTLYIGRNDEFLHNHEIVIKEKVYAIEKPKLLKDRVPNDKYINIIRRPIAPQCYHCYDKIEVDCKYCGCVICGGKNNPHLILVCDECEDEYHISCLQPPLLAIPEDDWYCAKCKTNENEIVKVGQLVKKRLLIKIQIPPKTKNLQKLSETNKEKIIPNIPRNHRGAIPGIEVGAWWENRRLLYNSGIHFATIAGIHGKQTDCAYSLILSGNYNDIDDGDEFIYTGAGGHGCHGTLKVPIANQTLTRANKALALNCNAKFNDEIGATSTDWRAGIPVRVIRNYKFSKFSKYAPTKGNRYDGLYKVVKYYPETDQSGFRLWRFLLKRDDPAPPPWTPAGKMRCSQISSTMKNENNPTETESLKVCNKNKKLNDHAEQVSKMKEEKDYHLDGNLLELIDKDSANCKLWENCKSYLSNGKNSFLDHVLLSLQCVCCHELVSKPVTTPCAHNICQNCLEKSFSAGLKFCPTCRFNFGTDSILVNKKLTKIVSLLFPKRNKE